MASPHEQLLSESDNVVEKSDDVSDMPSEVQVDESQMQDVIEENEGLSLLQDQEAVSETQLDNHESASLEANEEPTFASDGAEVPPEQHGITTSSDEEVHSDKITLLKRPDSAGKTTSQPGFSFGRPNLRSMDFTGTRKGPASSAVAGTDERMLPSPIATSDSGSPATSGQAPKQKRKGHKPRRYDTAPEQPAITYDRLPAAAESDDKRKGRKPRQIIQEDEVVASESQHIPRQPEMGNEDPTIEEEEITEVSQHPQNSEASYRNEAEDHSDPVSPSRSEAVPTTMHSEEPAEHYLSSDQREFLRSSSQQQVRNTPPRSNSSQSLHHVSNQHGGSRVAKSRPKSKPSRRVTEGSVASNVALKNPLPEINDYMQILWHKAKQLESYYAEKYADELETLETERQQVLESKEVLQNELQHANQETKDLKTTVNQQNGKLAKFETEVKKFKNYMNGLGKDFTALKQEAIARDHEREKLATETAAHQADREWLWQEMNLRTEAAATLRKETFSKLAESEQSLRDAGVQTKYLEQQLSQSVGLLAEERDRCSRLESQLGQLRGLNGQSEDKTIEAVKASEHAVLDKLSEIYKTFRGDYETDGVSFLLMETLTAVQAISTQFNSTGKDAALAKTAIEKLNESITEHLLSSTTTAEQTAASNFQTWLDEALRTLKGELQQYEDRVQQHAAQLEHAKTLQQKLERSDEQIASAKVEISSAREREIQLKEDNATLQGRIAALQNNTSPNVGSTTELDEATSSLSEKVRALENTKTELARKEAELSTLRFANDNLREQIHTLENRLEETRKAIVDLTAEKEKHDREVAASREQEREEMAKHADNYKAEVRNQVGNDLKRLTSERNRLEKQLKPVADELAACKTRLESIERDPRRRDNVKEQEVERLNNLVESQKQELKILRSCRGDRPSSAEGTAALKTDLTALTAQCEEQRKKALQLTEEKSALVKQLEDLRSEADAAKASEEEASTDLDRYRSNTEKTIKSLEQDLAAKQELVKRSETGYQRLKKSCDDAVQEEKNRSERHIKDLQDRLSEAQIEAQQAKEADEKFREDVEQSWQSNVQEHESKIAEIELKVAKAESEKNTALQENERLQQEQQKATDARLQTLTEQLDNALKRATIAEKKLQTQEQHSDETSTTGSRIYVPRIGDNITPAASLHSTAPTKPRKKVVRDSSNVLEDGPVPAPEELPPGSQKTSSVEGKATRGPVVEETQTAGGSYADTTTHFGPASILALSTDSDEVFTGISNEKRHLPEVVDETQSQDGLPSFAAVNSGTEALSHAQATRARPFDFSISQPQQSQYNARDQFDSRRHNQYTESQSLHDTSYTFGRQTQEGFQIFEDSPRGNTLTQPQEIQETQEIHRLSQIDEDAFTYRKSFAPPNSASKLVHRANGGTGTMRRTSDNARQSVDRDNVSDGSGNRGLAKNSPLQRVQAAADTRSSSPDWMQTSTMQRRSSYNTPNNSSGKRRTSRNKSGLIADPRLANRDPPVAPKRKSSGHITTGYEPERKKRLSSETGMSTEHSRHFSSQGRSQPSDQSTLPTMHSGPTNAQYQRPGQKAQSRMRTLAGGSSRTTRGVRQPSKNSQYSARFDQELYNR